MPVNAGSNGNAPVKHCLCLNQGVQRRVKTPHRFGLIHNAPGSIILVLVGK